MNGSYLDFPYYLHFLFCFADHFQIWLCRVIFPTYAITYQNKWHPSSKEKYQNYYRYSQGATSCSQITITLYEATSYIILRHDSLKQRKRVISKFQNWKVLEIKPLNEDFALLSIL